MLIFIRNFLDFGSPSAPSISTIHRLIICIMAIEQAGRAPRSRFSHGRERVAEHVERDKLWLRALLFRKARWLIGKRGSMSITFFTKPCRIGLTPRRCDSSIQTD